MGFNPLPDSIEGDCGVDVSTIHDLRNVRLNNRFPMDELVQNVLLQGLVVVLDTVGLTQLEGVGAVGQHHRHNLVLIVQQMAAVDVGDGNLKLGPLAKNKEKQLNLAQLLPHMCIVHNITVEHKPRSVIGT